MPGGTKPITIRREVLQRVIIGRRCKARKKLITQTNSCCAAEEERCYLIDAGGFSQVDGLPAIDKGAQGEVHVFYSGSALPATHSHDGLAAPDSSSSIEVEEATSCKLNILLTLAVEVQGDLLSL